MEQEVFFDFCSKLVSSTFQASPIDLKIDHLKLAKGEYSGIDFPIIFKQENGSKFCDILDTGYSSFYLISERMKTILEDNKLKGWKTFPIKLYDKKGNEISGYHGFSVTGRCGPINLEKSNIIEKQLVPLGPMVKFYKGISIDQWDGMDFFSPDKKKQILITEKAADILRKNKTTNMYLENVADYEINVRLTE